MCMFQLLFYKGTHIVAKNTVLKQYPKAFLVQQCHFSHSMLRTFFLLAKYKTHHYFLFLDTHIVVFTHSTNIY